jgi:hypothetical protein
MNWTIVILTFKISLCLTAVILFIATCEIIVDKLFK